MSLEARWLSLQDPPDWVAASIATKGLRLVFYKDANNIPIEPPLQSRHNPPAIFATSRSKIPVLRPFVENWLKRDILTQALVPPRVFLSRLFTVKKKNGKKRPVLDLSVLNTYIVTPSFRMETLDKVLRLISQVMWATSLDITDAYLSIPIDRSFQKFFCFLLDGVVYMFLRLPFGLTTAPWAFSRVMRPIKICLRLRGVQVTSFLDDFFIVAITKALCSLHTAWTEKLLIWLGFDVNYEKSSLIPLQSLEYLGILVNLRTLTLALPADKVSRILSLCLESSHSMEITRRELEVLVGLLNFAHPLLSLGRMWLHPVISWMNTNTSPVTRDLPVFTDPDLGRALSPFLNAEFLQAPISFRPPVPSLDLATDASDYGWSGVIGPITVHDSWTRSESSNSINWREIRAIHLSVAFLQDCLSGKTIRIHTDSMVAWFCLKRMGSRHSTLLNDITRAFLLFCIDRSISFVPVHISGCLNVLADQASRRGPISTEWCLDPDTFEWIFRRCPISPEVDLFATRANSRCHRYVSPCPDPRAFHVNALLLSFNWNQFRYIYAFPPPALMEKIIDRICHFKGTMVLIAPMVRSAPWLFRLLERASWWEPLPAQYFLFQVVDQEIITLEDDFWNLYLWVLFPTSRRIWSGET